MKRTLSFFILLLVWSYQLYALDNMLLIEEGFESGQLLFHVSGNSPVIEKVKNARRGNFVLKSELSNLSKVPIRTEIAIKGKDVNFDVGKEYWVGISIKIGKEFQNRSKFNDQGMLLQWHYQDWLHPEVPDAQPLLIRFKRGKVHVQSEVIKRYLATVPPAYGEWVDWVINVKFDDQDGIIKVWRNGVKIVDWSGDNHQVEKVEGAYLKLGLYSYQYKSVPSSIKFKRIVYHDELRIAGSTGSYASVAPRGNINN